MSFRFRRSIRIAPWLKLNVSKSGVSESVGRRGMWLNFWRRGTRGTIGAPGSGLSYTTKPERGPWPAVVLLGFVLVVVMFVFVM